MTMSPQSQIPVGFTFVADGKDWQGGLNYFRSLFLALQSLPDAKVAPVAFVGRGVDVAKYGFPPNVLVVRDATFNRCSFKWTLDKLAHRLLGVSWLTNRVVRRRGVRVLSHGPASGTRTLKSIGWIPDFQHVHLPQFFPEAELARRDKAYRELVATSDLLIVSSESARKDLERFAPAHAAKARVLRFCAVPPSLDAASREELSALYGLSGPYFYIPNQTWAHKNHLTAIRALARLRQDHPDVQVVCSGSLADYRNPSHLAALRAEIAKFGLEKRFMLLGPIPYPHIAPLMLHAEAVINPSLFEGWSTTVEEAKSIGAPLILSGIEVHREQCDAVQATFFEALDAKDLAARMHERLAKKGRRIDPPAALVEHAIRTREFANAYERIVVELAGSA